MFSTLPRPETRPIIIPRVHCSSFWYVHFDTLIWYFVIFACLCVMPHSTLLLFTKHLAMCRWTIYRQNKYCLTWALITFSCVPFTDLWEYMGCVSQNGTHIKVVVHYIGNRVRIGVQTQFWNIYHALRKIHTQKNTNKCRSPSLAALVSFPCFIALAPFPSLIHYLLTFLPCSLLPSPFLYLSPVSHSLPPSWSHSHHSLWWGANSILVEVMSKFAV